MKATVVYVYPMDGNGKYFDLAARFVQGYHTFPPAYPHETLVVCNGAPASEEAKFLFGGMPGLRFLQHDNGGYDIGAYQCAARECAEGLIVFFGASTYFRGAGWLGRMVSAFHSNGPGIYGAMGNLGDYYLGIMPHIRTTAFWMPADLFNGYPHRIVRPEQRYEFEHGRTCLTSWVTSKKLPCLVVNWSKVYPWPRWNDNPNGFHRGDQSELIAGDRVTEPPYYKYP